MQKMRTFVGCGLFVILFIFGSTNAIDAQELNAGDTAPAFELAGSDGQTHRLEESRATTVVLAWFPKAFTGG